MESYELACKKLSLLLKEYTEEISKIVGVSDIGMWNYSKKTTKVYPIDETGKKKRSAVGENYDLKIILSKEVAELLWKKTKEFAMQYSFTNIERLYNNEELGRYEFRAENKMEDSLNLCIYLENEWNIPRIRISLFVAGRYKKVDLEEISSDF